MTTTDLTNNNNNINNNVSHLNNGLLSHADNVLHQDQHQDAIINSLDVSGSDGDEDENDGTAQSLAEILDPELQPEPPIPNNPESQTIYREHRHMAKEYLSVDTNLYYAQDFKEKLIVQMDRAEREQKQELLRKINHKVRCQGGSNWEGNNYYCNFYRRTCRVSSTTCNSSGRSCPPPSNSRPAIIRICTLTPTPNKDTRFRPPILTPITPIHIPISISTSCSSIHIRIPTSHSQRTCIHIHIRIRIHTSWRRVPVGELASD